MVSSWIFEKKGVQWASKLIRTSSEAQERRATALPECWDKIFGEGICICRGKYGMGEQSHISIFDHKCFLSWEKQNPQMAEVDIQVLRELEST